MKSKRHYEVSTPAPKGEKAAGHSVARHGHSQGHKDGHIPHAGHGMHPNHPMLHSDGFHKNEHHG